MSVRVPGEGSCQSAISILTFPCFEQHRVGYDVLQLHVDAVWGHSRGSRRSSRFPHRWLQAQFILSEHRPLPPPTARPRRRKSALRFCLQSCPVTACTPPPLLFLLLLLLPPSLRPEACCQRRGLSTDVSLWFETAGYETKSMISRTDLSLCCVVFKLAKLAPW